MGRYSILRINNHSRNIDGEPNDITAAKDINNRDGGANDDCDKATVTTTITLV